MYNDSRGLSDSDSEVAIRAQWGNTGGVYRGKAWVKNESQLRQNTLCLQAAPSLIEQLCVLQRGQWLHPCLHSLTMLADYVPSSFRMNFLMSCAAYYAKLTVNHLVTHRIVASFQYVQNSVFCLDFLFLVYSYEPAVWTRLKRCAVATPRAPCCSLHPVGGGCNTDNILSRSCLAGIWILRLVNMGQIMRSTLFFFPAHSPLWGKTRLEINLSRCSWTPAIRFETSCWNNESFGAQWKVALCRLEQAPICHRP